MASPDMVSSLWWRCGTEIMDLTQRLMDVVIEQADGCMQEEGLLGC